MLLAHISAALLVLFRCFSEVLGKFRNRRWRIQDGRHLTIMVSLQHPLTTSLLIAGLKGNLFWTCSPSCKYHCHSFYTCKVMEEGRDGIHHPLAPEDKKTPGLDRVKVMV